VVEMKLFVFGSMSIYFSMYIYSKYVL